MELLKKQPKKQLIEKCKELNIKSSSSYTKDELVKLIYDTMNITEVNNSVNDNSTNTNIDICIKNVEGLQYLQEIDNNSIDLILTDPPYIISKESGMNEHYNNVKRNEENNIQFTKTEQEWYVYKNENLITNDDNKEKYMKYGSIYGKKYCVKTDYGEWDSEFTIEILDKFICEYYKKLHLFSFQTPIFI